MEALVALVVALLPFAAGCLWVRTRRARARRVWDRLERRPTHVPLRGYKVAQILSREQDAVLAGFAGRLYRVEEAARCLPRGCHPPGLDCSCGFYAFKQRAQATALLDELASRYPIRAYALLTVEFSGEVLEYELGYRAARQRVLQVELSRGCYGCRLTGSRDRAVTLAVASPSPARVARERAASARLGVALGGSPVRPVCRRHRPEAPATCLGPADLAGLLTTDVRWIGEGIRQKA